MYVYKVAYYLFFILADWHMEGALPLVKPVSDEIATLECQHEHVDVVVASKQVLVWVDEII
jgi:hypothetical protein